MFSVPIQISNTPQNSQELSCCVRPSNKGKGSNIVGGNAATPQTADQDTEEEPVFLMLACVQHECILHKFGHRLDPNPTAIVIEAEALFYMNFIQIYGWICTLIRDYFVSIDIINLYLFL